MAVKEKKEESRDRRLKCLRFVHPYYAINIMVILVYGVVRTYLSSPRLTTTHTWTGLSQEVEVVGLASVSLLSKYRKVATVDELLDRTFFLGKTAVTVLLYFIDVRLSLGYCICWAVLAMALHPPRVVMPAEVEALSPSTFQSLVRSPPAHTLGTAMTWVVMFHADWCSACINLEPMFMSLAKRYGNKERHFATLDVVAYPELAEELNINTSGASKQLPTLALFASGREICRLPTFGPDGQVVRARMDEHGVTKYLELDKDVRKTSYARKAFARQGSRAG
ncbi:unnamed protein product [Discosporangium mesarthrocarpum]